MRNQKTYNSCMYIFQEAFQHITCLSGLEVRKNKVTDYCLMQMKNFFYILGEKRRYLKFNILKMISVKVIS